MLKSQALDIIQDVRAQIARSGYSQIRDLGKLAVVFGDVRRAISLQPMPDLTRLAAVQALESRWRADRMGQPVFEKGEVPVAYGPGATQYGSLTIDGILDELSQHVCVLPAEVK